MNAFKKSSAILNVSCFSLNICTLEEQYKIRMIWESQGISKAVFHGTVPMEIIGKMFYILPISLHLE